jgi:hypothetical protein
VHYFVANGRKQQKADPALTWRIKALQTRVHFGTLESVGKFLPAYLLILATFSFARAQDQESKLVDRLLRPDMSLQNTAQKKTFIASDGTSISKQATVGTFYVQKKSTSKSFSGTHDFSARQYSAQSFNGTRSAFGISSRQPIGNLQPTYSSRVARDLRDAQQADKKVASSNFAGNRPFLDQGKSQKALSRKNPPLTIEQVRELLNKNK